MKKHIKIGFFEVCARQLTEDSTGYSYRPRVAPMARKLDELYELAKKSGAAFVFTTCCSGKMLMPDSRGEVLYIPISAEDTGWKSKVDGHRVFYIQKYNNHDMGCSIQAENYEPFLYNRNLLELVRLLDVEKWIVYGNGLDFCANDAVKGLLGAGCKVAFLSDVLASGATGYGNSGTLENRIATLQNWRDGGAVDMLSDELFRTAIESKRSEA